MANLSDLVAPQAPDGPSTGNSYAIRTNPQTITEDAIVSSGNNGLSAGPITIADGTTVTVEEGAVWTIVGG